MNSQNDDLERKYNRLKRSNQYLFALVVMTLIIQVYNLIFK